MPDAAKSDRSAPGAGSISHIQPPPHHVGGILLRLGPGLIIAGSIVGSGELIATTMTGAAAGFTLLWLIIVGCVIKVFAQVELGRYTIVTGRTALDGMNEVPGPRLRVNWLVWYWVAMFLASLGQLGGIVGGVGQALGISVPLTQQGTIANQILDAEVRYKVKLTEIRRTRQLLESPHNEARQVEQTQRLSQLLKEADALYNRLAQHAQQDLVLTLTGSPGILHDPRLNAAAIDFNVEQRLVVHWAEPIADVYRLSRHERGALVLQPLPPQESVDVRCLVVARPTSSDDKYWAALLTVFTAGILYIGRYGLIQTFSTVLVASFTLMTVINVLALQSLDDWAIRGSDLLTGVSFVPPPATAGRSALWIGLATFGIIGVGASELVSYPYWCLEKGYARFTGPREDSPNWADRARGWLRVLRWDCWCSMVVYTFATLAFYLLGAAILGRSRLSPREDELIRTLGAMYEPVFGRAAEVLFLFGAFAVLYSTFFVANAGHSRVVTDALRVFGLRRDTEESRRRWVKIFSLAFPTTCLLIYVFYPKPTVLILLSGAMQTLMLPMLAVATLYFRYYRGDPRLRPTRVWDVFLWGSSVVLVVTGAALVWQQYQERIRPLFRSRDAQSSAVPAGSVRPPSHPVAKVGVQLVQRPVDDGLQGPRAGRID